MWREPELALGISLQISEIAKERLRNDTPRDSRAGSYPRKFVFQDLKFGKPHVQAFVQAATYQQVILGDAPKPLVISQPVRSGP